MLFAPTRTDGFQLVHTAKQYLEIVPNPHRIKLDHLIPVWGAEAANTDVFISVTLLTRERTETTNV